MRAFILMGSLAGMLLPLTAEGSMPVPGLRSASALPQGAAKRERHPILRVQDSKGTGAGETPTGDPGSPEPTARVALPDPSMDGVAKAMPRSSLQPVVLFGKDDLIRIQELAAKHGMLVPEFELRIPAADVPVALRRLIGVWIDETGSKGKGRRTLVIVTGVEAPNVIHGFLSVGPPDATSFTQSPAIYFAFTGTLDGLTVRFQNKSNTASYSVMLTSDNLMLYHYANKKGQQTSRTLRPLWMLTLAERKARP